MEKPIIPTEILFKILSQNGQYCILNHDMRNKKNIYYVQFFEQNDEKNVKEFIIRVCKYGKIEIIKFLTNKYLYYLSECLNEAICVACSSGHLDVIKLLLDTVLPSSTDLPKINFSSILFSTILSNDLEVVKFVWNYPSIHHFAYNNEEFHFNIICGISTRCGHYSSYIKYLKIIQNNTAMEKYISNFVFEGFINSNSVLFKTNLSCTIFDSAMLEFLRLLINYPPYFNLLSVGDGIITAYYYNSFDIVKLLIERYSINRNNSRLPESFKENLIKDGLL